MTTKALVWAQGFRFCSARPAGRFIATATGASIYKRGVYQKGEES
jgi:hypothetical protein